MPSVSINPQNVNITVLPPVGTEPAGIFSIQLCARAVGSRVVKSIDLGFTRIEIHSDLVVSRTSAGETLTRDKCEQIMSAARPHIDKDYYLVLDEVHPYAIDLDALFTLRDEKSIVAICVVAYRNCTRVVLNSASDILNKPVFFFDTLAQATDFVELGGQSA